MMMNLSVHSLGFNDVADFIVGRKLRREVDRCFTTVFSYYLGVITPNYSKVFLAYEIIKGVCEAKDNIESDFHIFDCDSIYDLSPLGKMLMKNYYSDFNSEALAKFKLSDINAVTATRREQRKGVLKEFKKQKRRLLLNIEL